MFQVPPEAQLQMLQFAKCPLQVFSPASGHMKEADALQLPSAEHPVMHNAHVATSFRYHLKLCRRELQAEFGASWDVFTMAEALRSRAEGGRNRLRKASEALLQVPFRPRSAQLRASRFLVVRASACQNLNNVDNSSTYSCAITIALLEATPWRTPDAQDCIITWVPKMSVQELHGLRPF